MNKYHDFEDVVFKLKDSNVDFNPIPVKKLALNLDAKQYDLKVLENNKFLTSTVNDAKNQLRFEIKCIENKLKELKKIAKENNAQDMLSINKMPRFEGKEKITDENMFDKGELKSFTIEIKDLYEKK